MNTQGKPCCCGNDGSKSTRVEEGSQPTCC